MPESTHLPKTSSRIPSLVSKSEPKKTVPPCWNEEAMTETEMRLLSDLSDKPENTRRASLHPVSQSKDVDYASWENAPNSKCHASFGDQGATASVGSFGQLIQFSAHLDAGSSGMFSADHSSVPEPYYVEDRAAKLEKLSQQPFHCGPTIVDDPFSYISPSSYELMFGDTFPCGNPRYGLKFPNLIMMPDIQPSLKWFHWRWPCYEYSAGQFKSHPGLKLAVQWMIQDKTLLQRCVFENHGSQDIRIDLEFCKYMVIRDLDHLNPHYQFNKDDHGRHEMRPGPGGYSWISVHKFNTELHDQAAGKIISEPSTQTNTRSGRHDSLQGREDGVASSTPPPTEARPNDGSVSITVQGQSQDCGPQQQKQVKDNHSFIPKADSTCESKTESPKKSEVIPEGHDASPQNSYGVSVISSVGIDGQVQHFGDNANAQKWQVFIRGRRIPRPWEDRAPPLEVTVAYKMEHLKTSRASCGDQVISWHGLRTGELFPENQLEQSLRMCDPGPASNSENKKGQKAEDFSVGDIKNPAGASLSQNPEGRGEKSTEPELSPINHPVGSPEKSSPPLSPGALHSHLEFAAHRNLEHILSVCAVQVTTRNHYKADASTTTNALDDVDVKAIALTCGDMSGHRICWSASFFALQFLVESYKIIRDLPNGKQSSLIKRIKKTCLGHLKWLRSIPQQSIGQRFGANYWVTGKPMVRRKSSASWIAEKCLLDTAFQILKAAACMELWDENDKNRPAQCVADLMSEWAPYWLLSMKDSDKRKKYAWPHKETEGVNTFRLDEHVWIWRALKSLEIKNYRVWDKMSDKAQAIQRTVHAREQEISGKPSALDWEAEIVRLREIFPSEVVQREVSRRFMIEDTSLGKRMLATTRSIRESRFMLHSRDTALLYERPFDFLGKNSSAKELWKTTIQSQMNHTEYQESNWGKPLRHAFNIMLGAQELSINSTPPENLIRMATDVLIGSSSPNGLFPGRIEISTNKPVGASCIAEGHIESYYHASFEIPYILLTHMKEISAAYTQLEQDGQIVMRKSDSMPEGEVLKETIPHDKGLVQGVTERQVLLPLSDILLSRTTGSDLDKHEISKALGVRLTTKKAVPFDALVDSSNIVKLEDEWLYKYPEFLSRDVLLNEDLDGDEQVWDQSGVSCGQDVLDRDTERDDRFCIVDVPSSKRVEGKRKEHEPIYYKKPNELKQAINLSRTAQNSKKRLLSFRMIPTQVVSRCYTTTEESEISNLEDFFGRHSRHEKYSFDNCNMVHNYWQSEFHLSHYQLLRGGSNRWHGITPPNSEPFPRNPKMCIIRASASFRFHGDFFDRHWTCYMLDSTRKGPITDQSLLKDDRAYCQRKVLEQRYFADMLKSLNESVEEILGEVARCLGVESGSFSTRIDTANAYLAWRDVWQEFQPLLQKLHDDLASSQTVVHQWEAREEDRGKEKPRWTSNDERKYRGPIMTIRREIKSRKTELQKLHEKTKSLQDLCSNRLDKAREDLTFRSEQNIATFTYVTVVFLPIGFTASIFSMNGSPETSLAIEMVIASVIALTVTVLALINAKGLAGVLENIGISFKKLTAKAKRSSVIVRDRDVAAKKEIKPDPVEHKSPHLRVSSTDVMSWNLVFWAGYIFIELPARSITAACRAIGWPRDDPKDRKTLDKSGGTELVSTALHENASEGSLSPPASRKSADDCEAGDKQSKGKFEYTKATARVILACFTVLVLMPAWILQILCFNAWDALALLGELMRKAISCFSLPEIDKSEARLMTHLTNPPKYFRPMGMWKDYLRSEKKPPQPQTAKTEGDEKIPDSSPEKTSQAPR